VRTERGAYRLAIEHAVLDLDRFDHLVDQAERRAGPGRRSALENALELVRGDVLEDEPYAEWAIRLREDYRRRFLHTLQDAAEAALACGDLPAALRHAERAITEDPIAERGYAVAMIAAYASGRQDDALRVFERARAALESELGVDPLPETRDLRFGIIEQRAWTDLLESWVTRACDVGDHRAAGQ
jgi:DNA-binding SARP family transcriptional activator